jgi:hypothetical protein
LIALVNFSIFQQVESLKSTIESYAHDLSDNLTSVNVSTSGEFFQQLNGLKNQLKNELRVT